MKKRIAVFLAIPLVVSLFAASNAAADTPQRFRWNVSNMFIQNATGIPQTGAQAQADNGDIVRLSGRGRFNASTGTASGGGSFAHTDADGMLLGFGRWWATGVEDFDPYGCDGGGFPPNFCGGLLTLNVHVVGTHVTLGTAAFDGVLVIDCRIGPNVPAGAEEGITLDIPGLINFDDLIPDPGGLTLFTAIRDD